MYTGPNFSTYTYSQTNFIHLNTTWILIWLSYLYLQIFLSELNIHVCYCLGCIIGFSNLANWTSFCPYSTKCVPQPSLFSKCWPLLCLIRQKIVELSMTIFSHSPCSAIQSQNPLTLFSKIYFQNSSFIISSLLPYGQNFF